MFCEKETYIYIYLVKLKSLSDKNKQHELSKGIQTGTWFLILPK